MYFFAGLAQYSGDPRIEWHLKTHTTKEAVIDAVKNLPYKGGNTLTGTVPDCKQQETIHLPVSGVRHTHLNEQTILRGLP